MKEYSCTIRLQHEHAQRFFDEAMHPNLSELQRRDAFLASLEVTYPVRTEGTDLVVEIPDIDIPSLLSESETSGYISVSSVMYHSPLLEMPTHNQQHMVYYNSPMRSIAA